MTDRCREDRPPCPRGRSSLVADSDSASFAQRPTRRFRALCRATTAATRLESTLCVLDHSDEDSTYSRDNNPVFDSRFLRFARLSTNLSRKHRSTGSVAAHGGEYAQRAGEVNPTRAERTRGRELSKQGGGRNENGGSGVVGCSAVQPLLS